MLNDFLKSLADGKFILSLLCLLLLFVPGVTYIFYFNSNLFINLDLIKVILLSLAFVTPFIFINFLFLIINSIKNYLDSNLNSEFFSLFTLSVVYSGILIYTSLIFTYFFQLSFKNSVIICLILELISMFIIGLVIDRNKRINEKNSGNI
jgi:hypothetical protein